jgi:hypothetical protein
MSEYTMSIKVLFKPGLVVPAFVPAAQSLEPSNSRPTWATQPDPISNTKQRIIIMGWGEKLSI